MERRIAFVGMPGMGNSVALLLAKMSVSNSSDILVIDDINESKDKVFEIRRRPMILGPSESYSVSHWVSYEKVGERMSLSVKEVRRRKRRNRMRNLSCRVNRR